MWLRKLETKHPSISTHMYMRMHMHMYMYMHMQCTQQYQQPGYYWYYTQSTGMHALGRRNPTFIQLHANNYVQYTITTQLHACGTKIYVLNQWIKCMHLLPAWYVHVYVYIYIYTRVVGNFLLYTLQVYKECKAPHNRKEESKKRKKASTTSPPCMLMWQYHVERALTSTST